MKIISGTSHPELAYKIAQETGFETVDVNIEIFKNGETRLRIKGEIEGEHVAIIETATEPVDKHLFELFLLIDAARRLHPKRITVVMPWMGYSLQDKVFSTGEPISAKVVAKILSTIGSDDAVVMDLHHEGVAGFFDVPVKYLSAIPLFADFVKSGKWMNGKLMVVSPDFGGAKRARELAKLLEAPLAVIDKERSRRTGALTVHGISRPVKGYDCLVIDDVILSGGTVKSACDTLRAKQAKSVTFAATHGLFVGNAWEALNGKVLDRLVVADTVPISVPSDVTVEVKILSTAPLFAKALKGLAGE